MVIRFNMCHIIVKTWIEQGSPDTQDTADLQDPVEFLQQLMRLGRIKMLDEMRAVNTFY